MIIKILMFRLLFNTKYNGSNNNNNNGQQDINDFFYDNNNDNNNNEQMDNIYNDIEDCFSLSEYEYEQEYGDDGVDLTNLQIDDIYIRNWDDWE